MPNTGNTELEAWFDKLVSTYDDAAEGHQTAYQKLEAMNALSKVTVHKYQCPRGCQVARLVRIGSVVLCAVRDYKFSPGMNAAESVPAARKNNTLNGENWWPGHVYDVAPLAADERGGIQMVCSHRRRTVNAQQILLTAEGVNPGHPGKPTIL